METDYLAIRQQRNKTKKKKVIIGACVAAVITIIIVIAMQFRTTPDDFVELGGMTWRVLARRGNNIMIATEHVIGRGAFDEHADTVWRDSSLRAYLNSEFLNYFTPEEHRRIQMTTVSTNTRFLDTGEDSIVTEDYVFLFSPSELGQFFDHVFVFPASPENNIPNPYNVISTDTDGNPVQWWTRTRGIFPYSIIVVSEMIATNNQGMRADDETIGIRPVMWISMN